MNELQRMHYLDALGIEQYVPTRVLAHSAELRLCELPTLEEAGLEELPQSIEQERPLPQAAEVVNRLLDSSLKREEAQKPQVDAQPGSASKGRESPVSDIPREIDPPGSVSAEVEPAKPEEQIEQKPASEPVRFSLSLWQLSDGLLVLDSHQPRAALPTEKLLANILMAAKLLSLNLPRAGRIDWPLQASAPLEGGWHEAREYLEAFLDAAMSKQAIETLLVFGEPALKAVLEEPEAEGIQFSQGFKLPNLSIAGMYFPSLADILHHPEYKATVWKGLSRLETSGREKLS